MISRATLRTCVKDSFSSNRAWNNTISSPILWQTKFFWLDRSQHIFQIFFVLERYSTIATRFRDDNNGTHPVTDRRGTKFLTWFTREKFGADIVQPPLKWWPLLHQCFFFLLLHGFVNRANCELVTQHFLRSSEQRSDNHFILLCNFYCINKYKLFWLCLPQSLDGF